MRRLLPEVAYGAHTRLGEGPVWDAASGQLLFVDIFDGRLHRTTPDGGIDTLVELDQQLGAALPATDGRILLVTENGFSVLDLSSDATSVTPLLDTLSDRTDLRYNDAKCDPAGRAFAGTLSIPEAPLDCALFRLDDGPRVTTVVPDVGLSNGLGWSPDRSWMYYADTPTGRVDKYPFDLDSGHVGPRQGFLTGLPNPDGLCVDDEGCLWIALWDGGEVRRYTPDGELDAVIEMPVPYVTSCAFGDADGQTLYITTAFGSLSDQRRAEIGHVGDIFAVRPGSGGTPATPWRPVQGA